MASFKSAFTCCLAGVFCMLMSATVTVYAHKPLKSLASGTRSDPVIIPDHQLSQAAFAELIHSGQVDYYRFTVARAGETIVGSMLIPKLERLKEFSPALALIGPGLPRDTAGFNVENMLDVKDSEGVLVARYQGNTPQVFFEPFTQTRYWRRQELRIAAPSAGAYYFAVFDPTGNTGKYVFCIGERDDWQLRELAKLPQIWWQTRMFVEERISTYVIVTVLALMVLTIIYKVWVALTH